MNGYLDIVTTLIQAGADVNARDEWQFTPLKTAAEPGHIAITQLLLSHGAQVNDIARCDECVDDSALTIAAAYGQTAVVVLLLSAGAAVDHRANDGVTALMLASAVNSQAQV